MSGFYVKVNPNAVNHVTANSDKPTIFTNLESGGKITVTPTKAADSEEEVVDTGEVVADAAALSPESEKPDSGDNAGVADAAVEIVAANSGDPAVSADGNGGGIAGTPAEAADSEVGTGGVVAGVAAAESGSENPGSDGSAGVGDADSPGRDVAGVFGATGKAVNALKKKAVTVRALNTFRRKSDDGKKVELETKLNNMDDNQKAQIFKIVSTEDYKKLQDKINESKEKFNVEEVEKSIQELNSNHTNVSDQVIKFLIFFIFAPITFPVAVFQGGKKSRRRRKGKGKKGKSMKRRGTRGKKAKK